MQLGETSDCFPLCIRERENKGGKLSNSLIGFQTSLRGEMLASSLPNYKGCCVL